VETKQREWLAAAALTRCSAAARSTASMGRGSIRRANQNQDARTPMIRIIANHGVKKSTRFLYRFPFE